MNRRRNLKLLVPTAFAVSLAASWVVGGWIGGPSATQLELGHRLFTHEWQPHDPLAHGGDGLGPVFNARSCVACHFQGGTGGGGPNEHNVRSFEALLPPGGLFSSGGVFGGVVHGAATRDDLHESFTPMLERFPSIKQQPCLPEKPRIVLAEINSTALFGAGLIDGISAGAIAVDGTRRLMARVSENLKADFTGIDVGRVRMLPGGGVGRFGWKGQFASLTDFVGAACAVELGLTNPRRAQDVPHRHVPDDDAKPDLDRRQFRALVAYVASLPRPIEVLPSAPADRRAASHGRRVFAEIGCAECHKPDLGGVEGLYSDLRLYSLADPGGGYHGGEAPIEFPADHPEAEAWKTPPLWGVADSAPYMHHGAAATLELAIEMHGGQAARVRRRYRELPEDDRRAVIAFLRTLRAPGCEAEPAKADSADIAAAGPG